MTAAHVITLGLGVGLNQDVQAWFRQFNYLPPLPLTAVRVDTHEGTQTFDFRADRIDRSRQTDSFKVRHDLIDRRHLHGQRVLEAAP